jgi:hypothetical protein
MRYTDGEGSGASPSTVPERLVPEVRAAIQNGRRLQELINQAGARYVSALKREDMKRNR